MYRLVWVRQIKPFSYFTFFNIFLSTYTYRLILFNLILIYRVITMSSYKNNADNTENVFIFNIKLTFRYIIVIWYFL